MSRESLFYHTYLLILCPLFLFYFVYVPHLIFLSSLVSSVVIYSLPSFWCCQNNLFAFSFRILKHGKFEDSALINDKIAKFNPSGVAAIALFIPITFRVIFYVKHWALHMPEPLVIQSIYFLLYQYIWIYGCNLKICHKCKHELLLLF